MHKKSFHVTLRTFDCELSSHSIPASWSALKKLLSPFKALHIKAVYEAGYFGYWLYRHLSQWGVCCRVTPPSLIPQVSGNRVKTDRKDSKKLAFYLSRGMLKSIFVPSEEGLIQRKLIRHRRQLINDRNRVQNRIKSDLCFHGEKLPSDQGFWSRAFLSELSQLSERDASFGLSLQLALEQLRSRSSAICFALRTLMSSLKVDPFMLIRNVLSDPRANVVVTSSGLVRWRLSIWSIAV